MDMLRQRAQQRLLGAESGELSALSDAQLLEEARIYQIELSLQHEELEKTHQALSEKSARLEILFEEAPVGYIETDKRGHIRRMNAKARQMFSVRWGDTRSLLSFVRADDVDKMMKLINGRSTPTSNIIGFQRGNAVWWGEVQVNPITQRPGVHALLCAINDATARYRAEQDVRRSESDLRQLLDQAPDAVLLLRKGGIVYANRYAHQLLGFSSGNLVGMPIDLLFEDSERDDIWSWLRRYDVDTPPEGRNLEFSLRTHQDERVRVEGRVMPIVYATRPVLVLSCRDLTERRRLESRIAHADKLSSLGVLVAGIAHEINNPLTAIQSSLDVLFDELEKTPTMSAANRSAWSELTETARGGVRNVARIVRDLRSFSQVREFRQEAFQINEVAYQTLRMIEHRMLGRAQLAHDLGRLPMIIGDRERLSQVLLNLLFNAQAAMPERPPDQNRIRLRTFGTDEEILIEVSDNGIGIPEGNRSRLFNPFFTTRREVGGTGLGLAVSNSIIQQMGGWIEVDSVVGEGSRFIIHLPRPAKRAHTPPPQPLPEDQLPSLQQILLVDNEPLLQASLSRLLEYYGTVTVADSGNAAIDLLSDDMSVDFILSDILMSNGDGITLLHWIKTHRPALLTRLVFMTGMLTASKYRELTDAGCIVLEKPIGIAEIERAIRQTYAARAGRIACS